MVACLVRAEAWRDEKHLAARGTQCMELISRGQAGRQAFCTITPECNIDTGGYLICFLALCCVWNVHR